MRILQLARRYVESQWGGTETVIRALSKEFVERGHLTELWCSSAFSKPGLDTTETFPIRRYNYQYPFFGLSKKEKHALDKKGGNMLSFSMLHALASNHDFDIYHLHTGKRLGAEVAWMAKRRRKPVVMQLHGGVIGVPKEEQAHLLEPIQGHLEWGKAFGWLFGSRRLLDEADAIISVNKEESVSLKGLYPNSRVLYLPNAIDPKPFEKANGARFKNRYGIDGNAKVLMCVSRIDPQKNQALLLDAFLHLKKRHKGLHLVLIGAQTSEAYADKLQKTANESGAGNGFHLLAPIPAGSVALADAFNAADVFVLPSIHEPFGIVVLEAWAAGRAVVASKTGGLAHFIDDGKDGLFFPSGGQEALEHRIESLLNDPQKRIALGERGKEKALREYTWTKVGSRLLNLYEELLQEQR